MALLYEAFTRTFLEQWNAAAASEKFRGELYHAGVFQDDLLSQAQELYLASLWRDGLGFAGMKMIRRVVGISHVEDLDGIENADQRAACEKRTLILARKLVVASYHNSVSELLPDVPSLLALARSVYKATPAAAWVE